VLGENDVHVILDLPENLIAAAISLAVMSTGATISLPFWISKPKKAVNSEIICE